tara:strand:- start:292 stop:468 length:177 start_codon:yes stop_codon:yes gene_type:complete
MENNQDTLYDKDYYKPKPYRDHYKYVSHLHSAHQEKKDEQSPFWQDIGDLNNNAATVL